MGFFDPPDELHSAGGSKLFPMLPGCRGAAQFSPGKQVYRHTLTRTWGAHKPGPYALWIGMNPSTALADRDDPTIRRELIYTMRWLPVACYIKINVCDYRATEPGDLLKPGVRPCSPRNIPLACHLIRNAHTIVVGWGNVGARLPEAVADMESALRANAEGRVWCLELNESGSPKHPLYVKGDTPLQEYRLGLA